MWFLIWYLFNIIRKSEVSGKSVYRLCRTWWYITWFLSFLFFFFFFFFWPVYSSTKATGNPAVAFALNGVGKGELGQAAITCWTAWKFMENINHLHSCVLLLFIEQEVISALFSFSPYLSEFVFQLCSVCLRCASSRAGSFAKPTLLIKKPLLLLSQPPRGLGWPALLVLAFSWFFLEELLAACLPECDPDSCCFE